MARNRYLVVVYAPKPAKPGPALNQSYSPVAPPTVKWITASSEHAAASEANVEPGGHALVIDEDNVGRFDRAAKAPLEPRKVNGEPWPQAVHV